MWQQMYEQAEAGAIKANARENLRVLDALDQADRLAGLVAEAEAPPGRRPARLAELREGVGRAAGRRGRGTLRL